MEGAAGSRYWCHTCSQEVNPVVEVELNCPSCHGGFIEEVNSTTPGRRADELADHALTLWAPILLGMMGGNSQNRQGTRQNFAADEDGEIESNVRRRRSPAAAVLQLLQGISTDLENSENERTQEQEQDRIILINPFNQGLNPFGDFLMGPGLDILMQHLAENDSSRHGSLPAQKEAVDALVTVKVQGDDDIQCAICLDEFEPDAEAKEMPCKHRFHANCLLPWLECHNSCPVCRHQLPVDESKRESANGGSVRQTDERGGTENPFGLLPWFLNALSAPRATSLSDSPSPGSPPRGPRAASRADGDDVD